MQKVLAISGDGGFGGHSGRDTSWEMTEKRIRAGRPRGTTKIGCRME